MLTNREVKVTLKRLQGCLEGYIHAIDQRPELLDEAAELQERSYCQFVKDFGLVLTMLGDVNPG